MVARQEPARSYPMALTLRATPGRQRIGAGDDLDERRVQRHDGEVPCGARLATPAQASATACTGTRVSRSRTRVPQRNSRTEVQLAVREAQLAHDARESERGYGELRVRARRVLRSGTGQTPRWARTAWAARRPLTRAPCCDGVSRWSPATNSAVAQRDVAAQRARRGEGGQGARDLGGVQVHPPVGRHAVEPAQLAAHVGLGHAVRRPEERRRHQRPAGRGSSRARPRSAPPCWPAGRPCRRGAASAACAGGAGAT